MKLPTLVQLVAAILILGGSIAHAADETPAQALPPIETATFDEHRGFLVNGKPFFPIVLYGPTTDDDTLKQLHEFGFNVLQCRADVTGTLPAKGFYAATRSRKPVADPSSVFLAMGADSPAMYFKKDLLKQTADANAPVAAAFPGRPVMTAIGYWEDEPAGVVEGKLPSKEHYEDLVAALDVSAPYLYPVPYQPVATVGEATARARAATGGKKPLLPILQLFAWKPEDRFPTPAELRCMTYLALVEGAHGIGFYTYTVAVGPKKGSKLPEVQPELWNSVKELNREIAEIGPLLVAGKPSAAFKLNKVAAAIKTKAIDYDDETLAVIVNSAATPQEIEMTWPAGGLTGTLDIASGEVLTVDEGTATLRLVPFGVKVLRWKQK